MKMIKILFLTFLCSLPLCCGYSTGPPAEACVSMMPSHDGNSAQTSAAPFSIATNATMYMKGDPIKVTVTANSASTPFRGFFIQARKAGSNDAIGTFNIGTETDVKLMNCGSGSNNAVSHSSSVQKIKKEFVWMNPGGSDVTFQATFVNIKSTFWTMVKSAVVQEDMGSTTASSTTEGATGTTKKAADGAVAASHCGLLMLVLLAIPFL